MQIPHLPAVLFAVGLSASPGDFAFLCRLSRFLSLSLLTHGPDALQVVRDGVRDAETTRCVCVRVCVYTCLCLCVCRIRACAGRCDISSRRRIIRSI